MILTLFPVDFKSYLGIRRPESRGADGQAPEPAGERRRSYGRTWTYGRTGTQLDLVSRPGTRGDPIRSNGRPRSARSRPRPTQLAAGRSDRPARRPRARRILGRRSIL